jgi:hypothetical protein
VDKLFCIKLINSETEPEIIVSNGNKLLIGDDSFIDNGLELDDKHIDRPTHEFLHIMQMQLVVPAGRRQLKHFINELEQVHNAIGFNILVVLIHKNVIFFLLLHDPQNDILKVRPRQSHIYLAQLFHAVHELNIRYVALDD